MCINFYILRIPYRKERISENEVRKFYERWGFKLFRVSTKSEKLKHLRNFLSENGKPDYVAILSPPVMAPPSQISQMFPESPEKRTRFVEVKGDRDGLRLQQVRWISKYHREFPVDVIYLDHGEPIFSVSKVREV